MEQVLTKHLQESIEMALLIFRKSVDLHLVLKFGIVDLYSVLELGSVDLHSVLELGSVDLYSVLGFCNFANWTKPNRDRLQKCRSGHSIVFRSPFSLVVGLFAFDPRPSYLSRLVAVQKNNSVQPFSVQIF